MRPIYKVLTIVDDPVSICALQGSGGTLPLTLAIDGTFASGGVATQPSGGEQIVTFTTVADESTETATIIGTTRSGTVVTEAVALTNASTSLTANYYATVTSVIISGSSPLTGDVSVGWTFEGEARTQPFPVNWRQAPGNITLGMEPFPDPTVASTVLSTMQYSLDDPQDPSTFPNYNEDAAWRSPTTLVDPADPTLGLNAATDTRLDGPVRAIRGVIQSPAATTGTQQWRYTIIQGNTN